MRGCDSSVIPLEKFEEVVSPYLITLEEMKEQCQEPSEFANSNQGETDFDFCNRWTKNILSFHHQLILYCLIAGAINLGRMVWNKPFEKGRGRQSNVRVANIPAICFMQDLHNIIRTFKQYQTQLSCATYSWSDKFSYTIPSHQFLECSIF